MKNYILPVTFLAASLLPGCTSKYIQRDENVILYKRRAGISVMGALGTLANLLSLTKPTDNNSYIYDHEILPTNINKEVIAKVFNKSDFQENSPARYVNSSRETPRISSYNPNDSNHNPGISASWSHITGSATALATRETSITRTNPNSRLYSQE